MVREGAEGGAEKAEGEKVKKTLPLLALFLFLGNQSFARDKREPTIYDVIRDMSKDILVLQLHDDENRKRIDAIESKLSASDPSDPYRTAIKEREKTWDEERLQNIETKIRNLEINQQLRGN